MTKDPSTCQLKCRRESEHIELINYTISETRQRLARDHPSQLSGDTRRRSVSKETWQREAFTGVLFLQEHSMPCCVQAQLAVNGITTLHENSYGRLSQYSSQFLVKKIAMIL